MQSTNGNLPTVQTPDIVEGGGTLLDELDTLITQMVSIDGWECTGVRRPKCATLTRGDGARIPVLAVAYEAAIVTSPLSSGRSASR
jgi:hypothetical protein